MLALLIPSAIVVFSLSAAAVAHRWLVLYAHYRARREGL